VRYEASIRDTFNVTSVSGDEFLCMCPWHDDTSQGHLYVNGIKGLYLCMSCGAKGSLANLSLPRIVVGSDDVREKIERFRKGRKPIRFHPEAWLRQFDVPHDYWTQERGLPSEVVHQFRLGYDPFTNRCTMPLRDAHGRILGVTYRRLDGGKPKYLHPKGFPTGKYLYGAWLLGEERTVALVEGQVDACRGWASRVPALALMGARITRDQIKALQHLGVRTVVLMLDNDAAGLRGTVQIAEAMKGSGIRVKSGWYRDYWMGVKDPDGLSPQRYRKMYHSALPMTQWAGRVVIPEQ
jgi:DNA primase